jgi:hypothetical protein
LDLDGTLLDGGETIPGVVAHPWIDLNGDGVLDDLSPIPRTAISTANWTAGAVYSTAAELAEWARALFGWFGVAAVGLAGSGLGYSGVMAHLPDTGISMAVLMNDNNLDCLFASVSALVGEVQRHGLV